MPTDFSTQEEDWKSRLSRAMALQGQLGQTQQGQMVSGHYVPNYGGIIAGLVNSFIGQRQEKDARAGLDELGKERRKASAQQISNLFNPQAVQPQVQQTTIPQPAAPTALPAPRRPTESLQQWEQDVAGAQQRDQAANTQFAEDAQAQTAANNKQALADALISQDENVRAAAMQILKGQQEAGKAGKGDEWYSDLEWVAGPDGKAMAFRKSKFSPELKPVNLQGTPYEKATITPDGLIYRDGKLIGKSEKSWGPVKQLAPGVVGATNKNTGEFKAVTPTPDPLRALEFTDRKERIGKANDFLQEQYKKAIAGQKLTKSLVGFSNLMNSDAGVMSGVTMPVQRFASQLASAVGLPLSEEQKARLANTETAQSALAEMLPSVFAQVPGKSVDADAEAKRLLAQLPNMQWTPAAQRAVVNRLIEVATEEGRLYQALKRKKDMAQRTGNWDDLLLELEEIQGVYGTEDAAAQVQPPAASGGFNWNMGRP